MIDGLPELHTATKVRLANALSTYVPRTEQAATGVDEVAAAAAAAA